MLLIAGDLGGLFGLFLGGSAMSIFEFIDLLIYNAVVKLTTRRKIKPTAHAMATKTIVYDVKPAVVEVMHNEQLTDSAPN